MIPPHIYEEIRRRGTPEQQRKATVALERDARLRDKRARKGRELEHRKATPTIEATGTSARHTHDAEHGRALPGTLTRTEEADRTGDEEVDQVHDAAGVIRDYLQTEFDRNSMDDHGINLISSVRWDDSPQDPGYGNAVMDGDQTAYGVGDELFTSFALLLDISVHEWVHMLNLYTANMEYWGQWGAGNEGYSDRFAMVLLQKEQRQSVLEASWLVGEGLWREHIQNGKALRSFKDEIAYGPDPLVDKDPQPKHMRNYDDGSHDNQGVHINSGIVNHAAYLAAMELKGNLWEKLGPIWYGALTTKLGRMSDFNAQAAADHAVAEFLYGTGSLEAKAVRAGYKGVGLEIDNVEQPPGSSDDSQCPTDIRAAFRRLAENPHVFALLNNKDIKKLLAYGRAIAPGKR